MNRLLSVALAAPLLWSCTTSSPSAPLSSGTPGVSPSSSVRAELRPGDINPCTLVTHPEVARAAGVPVTGASAFRSIFTVPGSRETPAFQCSFRVRATGLVQGINLRVGQDLAEVIFAALSRIDSAGLQRIDHPPPPAIEAFWQPVGRTMWLRDAKDLVAVEIVTAGDRPGDEAAARSLGLQALSSLAGQ